MSTPAAEIIGGMTRRGFLQGGISRLAEQHPVIQAIDRTARFLDPSAEQVGREIKDLNPQWSPDGGQILFRSNRNGKTTDIYHLWVMDPDGKNPHPLTNFEGDERDASWSPDGKKIVFTAKEEKGASIKTVNADGTGGNILAYTHLIPYRPVWTPGGETITYAAGLPSPQGYAEHDGNTIWTMKNNGDDRHKLFDHEFVVLGKLAWSEDGAYLAIQEAGDFIGALWAFKSKNNSLIQIVPRGIERFSWSSANGHVLTFPLPPEDENGHTNLISYHLDWNEGWVTAYHPHAENPSWSPDGYGLVYQKVLDQETPGTWTHEIHVERLGGLQVIPWGPAQGFSEFDFKWSPQGDIIFSASRPTDDYPDYVTHNNLYKITRQGKVIQLTGQTDTR